MSPPTEGPPGDLQPKLAGKGGLPSGAAAPEATIGNGEADLGASGLFGRATPCAPDSWIGVRL